MSAVTFHVVGGEVEVEPASGLERLAGFFVVDMPAGLDDVAELQEHIEAVRSRGGVWRGSGNAYTVEVRPDSVELSQVHTTAESTPLRLGLEDFVAALGAFSRALEQTRATGVGRVH